MIGAKRSRPNCARRRRIFWTGQIDRIYGLRELLVCDLNGYVLVFAEG